jgi:hypothetical protein
MLAVRRRAATACSEESALNRHPLFRLRHLRQVGDDPVGVHHVGVFAVPVEQAGLVRELPDCPTASGASNFRLLNVVRCYAQS